MPSVERLLRFFNNCGTPSIASVNTAKNPTSSMNQFTLIIKYIVMAQTIANTTIQSTYDWKSVHAQKYLLSNSVIRFTQEALNISLNNKIIT